MEPMRRTDGEEAKASSPSRTWLEPIGDETPIELIWPMSSEHFEALWGGDDFVGLDETTSR